MNLTSTVTRHGVVHEQSIKDPNAKPSWKRSGTGVANFDMRGCRAVEGTDNTPWLQVIVTECGEKTSRAAFFTLDREGIEAVRAMCDYVLSQGQP